jgi:hypothetical protein
MRIDTKSPIRDIQTVKSDFIMNQTKMSTDEIVTNVLRIRNVLHQLGLNKFFVP